MSVIVFVGDTVSLAARPKDLARSIDGDAQVLGLSGPGEAIDWLRGNRADLIVIVGSAADPAANDIVHQIRLLSHCAAVPVISLAPPDQVNGTNHSASGGADLVLAASIDVAGFGRVGRSLLGAGRRTEQGAQKRRLESILDVTYDDIYLINANTLRIEQADTAALENVGYLESEIGRLTLPDLMPNLSEADLAAVFEPLRRGERRSATLETQVRRKDGSLYFAEVRLRYSDDENPAAFVAVVTDISERKRTLTNLSESEKRFKDFAGCASDWLWETDDRLRFTFLSGRMAQTTGTDRARCFGKTRWEVAGIDPDRDARWARHRDDMEAHRPFHDFRYDLIDGKGRQRFVRTSGVPVFDEEGNFRGYRGSANDATSEIEALERAREAELQLSDAMESVSQGFALYDAEDRLVLSNPRYRAPLEAVGMVVRSGARFEDLLKRGLAEGVYADAVGREGEWLKERLLIHQGGNGSTERQFSDGRWFLIEERRTSDGNTVALSTDITAQKRVELALRDSEERFKHFAEAASDWFWEMDENLRFSYLSDRYKDVTGVDPAQVLGRTRQELGWIDEDEEKWRKHLADLAARRPFRDFRYTYQASYGSRRHWSVSGKPVFDADGQFTGYRGSSTDITAEIEAQSRAEQAEANLRQAIEAISDGFALYDASDRLVMCNDVYRSLYSGSAPAIVPGNSFEDILRFGIANGQYEEAIGREGEWLQARMAAHRRFGQPFEQRLGDGRWLRVTEYQTKDGGTVGIRTDITDLKVREQELAGKTALLEAILASMAQGLVVFDADLTIIAANDQASRLLGIPPSMLELGANFGAVIRLTAERGDYGEGSPAEHIARYQAIARSGESRNFERRLPNDRYLGVRSTPLPGGGTVATYTDITDQKQAEQAARDSAAETRTILDTVPDGIIAIDLEGEIHTFNPAAERIFGYEADEAVGANIKMLMPAEIAKDHDGYLAAFANKPNSRVIGRARELTGRRKDGTPFPMSLTINAKPRGGRNIVTGIIRDITEQRLAEQELRLTKFSVDRARDAAFWVAPDGHFLFVNDSACQILGYDREELLGLAVWDVNIDIPKDRWPARWNLIKESGFVRSEMTQRTKDGRSFPVEITSNYLEYDGEEYCCSFARDITELKRAQEAREVRQELLRRQNEVLGQLAKRLAVASFDPRSALREITEAAVVTLNVERAGIWNIGDSGDRAICLNMYERSTSRHTSGGELLTFEHAKFFTALETQRDLSIDDVVSHAWTKSMAESYFGPNGVTSILAAPIYVAGNLAGLFCAEHAGEPRGWLLEERNFIGALAHLVSLAIETQERREAEKRLRLTQFLMDRASDAAFWTGAEGQLLYVNDSACAALGYSRDELLAMTVLDIEVGLSRDEWDRHWATIKAAGSCTKEVQHRTKNGRLFPVEVTANYLDFDGKAYKCAFARDISERKGQEERARQSEKMQALGQLAGGISHEFNNILTTVAGFTRMAMKHAENPERVRECLTEVSEASNRAAGLTRQMLTFSHKQVLEPKVLRVGEVLRGMEKLLRAYMEETILLNLEIADGRTCAEIDQVQLTQAVINLAINARHAMLDGGSLTIGCEAVDFDTGFATQQGDDLSAGRYARIYVTDTGIGMDRSILTHIFEPFFTTKEAGKGTGLGLSLVYGMVRNSGGVIDVESEVGVGTTFSIYLPVVDRDPVEDAEENNAVDEDIGGHETILVAEDDRQLRTFVRTTLEDLGYTVLVAPNGMEAVKLYDENEQRIQLLLTDVIMPEMDGLALVKALVEKRPELKVIYMTGYAPELTEHLDKLSDDICLIKKPFQPEALGRLVREVLQG